MKKETKNYVVPQIMISETDLQFVLCLCTSQHVGMFVEVDEYNTFEEEVIDFE